MFGIIDLVAALVQQILAPITLTNGSKAALQALGGGAELSNFVVNVGAGGGSATVSIEQSADGVTGWTAVNDTAGNAVSFALVAGDANTVKVKNGFRNQPYVRATIASVSGTILAGVNLVEGNVYAAPVGEAGGYQTDYAAS